MKGKLIIFSGPSGSGKTTIVHHLLKSVPGLKFSISVTSREIRNNEIDGKDYYFVSPEEFKRKINKNEFLEWEEVYEGQYYGTLKSEVEKIRNHGNHVVFDMDVEGGVNLKKQFGNQALAIFIMVPSLQILEERLRLRSTEDQLSFTKRIEKAGKEMTYSNKFDAVINNLDIDDACNNVIELVMKFLNPAE